MEKRNGCKFFENNMVRQSRLSNQDLIDLGITREQADKQAKNWRNATGGIIPGSNEKGEK
jgi:hypothetical protein